MTPAARLEEVYSELMAVRHGWLPAERERVLGLQAECSALEAVVLEGVLPAVRS